MSNSKEEFVRPFTNAEFDSLFESSGIDKTIKEYCKKKLNEVFQEVLNEDVEETDDFNVILDEWHNFFHNETASVREEAWNRLQPMLPIFLQEIENGHTERWANLVVEWRNDPFKYDQAYDELKEIDAKEADREANKLMNRIMDGKSDVFKEYFLGRLWDPLLNRFCYEEGIQGQFKLTEKFEKEYNNQINDGKSMEYAWAFAQMTIEEDFIEEYCHQYAKIYERVRANGLDKDAAWRRAHTEVEFIFENCLDGDCPEDIVDKYAQLCADYVEKRKTESEAKYLAYMDLFPE